MGQLITNRGRFLEISHMVVGPEEFNRRLRLEGVENLASLATGRVLVLGWHLGPVGISKAIQLQGYSLLSGGEGTRFDARSHPAWSDLDRALRRHRWSDPPSRAAGLLALISGLRAGGVVNITGDANMTENPLFEIPLAGGNLPVNRGWYTLRWNANAAVLPASSRLERGIRVVRFHPVIPPPGRDVPRDDDLGQCREVLTRIVQDYVDRYPQQCTALATGATTTVGELRGATRGARRLSVGLPNAPGLPRR